VAVVSPVSITVAPIAVASTALVGVPA
jgi:hypothetical protein